MRDTLALETYQQRRDILLDACALLKDHLQASFQDLPGVVCSCQVLDLKAFLASARAARDLDREVWRASKDLVTVNVVVPAREVRTQAIERLLSLFTVHERGAGGDGELEEMICVFPPWAKPSSWIDKISLPTRLTVRFALMAERAPHHQPIALSPNRPLTLVLSGGGTRAALFQLGLMTFLAGQNRLKDVQEIVSVSGGTILSCYFAKHWKMSISGLQGFDTVAADFLNVVLADIRSQALVPWLWTKLWPLSWGRDSTYWLIRVYTKIFGRTTLGDLEGANQPQLAIVVTDSIRRHRVAFTTSEILQWPVNFRSRLHGEVPSPVISKGVELALATAASSCFPPIFRRLRLTHKELGVRYDEFQESMDLNDGGVMTNLGIEVLVALREAGWTNGTTVLFVDAERAQAHRPGNSSLSDIDATSAALSTSARQMAEQEFGAQGVTIQFSQRTDGKEGLSHRAQTALASFRTDLDAPSWSEVVALLLHGAMVARHATQKHLPSLSHEEILSRIAAVVAKAGGPRKITVPDESALARCGKRPVGNLVCHVVAASIVVGAGVSGLAYVIYRLASQ